MFTNLLLFSVPNTFSTHIFYILSNTATSNVWINLQKLLIHNLCFIVMDIFVSSYHKAHKFCHFPYIQITIIKEFYYQYYGIRNNAISSISFQSLCCAFSNQFQLLREGKERQLHERNGWIYMMLIFSNSSNVCLLQGSHWNAKSS